MKFNNKNIIFAILFPVLALNAYAQSPPEKLLQEMVQQLQTTPDDNALREKIIKLATDMKPAPTIPPEAKRSLIMANTYQKEAKSASDFELAISAYRDALKIAPWWGDAYYNLSVALESAGHMDGSRDALNFYLFTNPADVEEAQNRLYTLEAKKNLAARQASEVAAAASVLIVPGESIGPVRLGMTADEVQRLIGAPDSVDGVFWRYARLGLTLIINEDGVVTSIATSDDRYSTSEGLKAGVTIAESDQKLGGPPDKTQGPPTPGWLHVRCYLRNGGAIGVEWAGKSSIYIAFDCN